MHWMPPAVETEAVAIELALQRADQAKLQNWPGRRSMGTRPIGVLGPTGEDRNEIPWILRRNVHFAREFREKLDRSESDFLQAGSVNLEEVEVPRGFFWGHHEDSRFIVEYAFD